MAKKIYTVRYVHRISPKDTDVAPDIELDTDSLLTDASISNALLRRSLGRALREAKLLIKGQRLNSCRIDKGGRYIVCFPADSVWHSIILDAKNEVAL